MIEIQHLSKSFGETSVLEDISISIPANRVVAIIGPSGSGKSTLLRCLNGLEILTTGTITVADIEMNSSQTKREMQKAIHAIRQQTGMVFQQFNLYAHKTVIENVMEALVIVKKMDKKQAFEKAEQLLKKVGLAEKLHSYPSKLSGGQQQRVAIARALAMEPKIMLFDEPTSALDPELVGDVLKVMRDLAEEGMTMIVVTHEMKFAHDVADRILFMADGKIVEDAEPKAFFNNPQTKRAQQFLKQVNQF